jgi:hypothetical protein
MTIAAVLTAMSAGHCLTGCGESAPETKKLQQKLGETWDAMKSWGVEKKEEFVRNTSPKLDDLKRRFAEVRVSGSRMSGEAAQRLETDWTSVQQKFDSVKTATGEQWARHRDAFVEAYAAFQKKLAESSAK